MAQPTLFQSSISRRWLIVFVAAAVLALHSLTKQSPSVFTLSVFVGVALALNLISWAATRVDTSHAAFTVLAFSLDVALVTVPIVAVGGGGLLLGLLAISLPYTARAATAIAGIQIAACSVTYIAAVKVHDVFVSQPRQTLTDVPVTLVADVFLFVFVAVVLRVVSQKFNQRFRRMNALLPAGAVESATANTDAVATLEASLRALTQRVDNIITNSLAHTQVIAESAKALRISVRAAAKANATLVESSSTVAGGFEAQRRGAEAGERRGLTAAEYARELQQKTDTIAREVSSLLQHAESARKQIQQSHDALTSIEYDAGGTLDAIGGIKKTATTAHQALQNVLGLARQTHVLALNTAIKSVNSEASHDTSSHAAARFRSFAAETSASAREAVHLVDEMTEYVSVAERATLAGHTQARDAVMFTETATTVLRELHRGALRSNEVTAAAADVIRTQAQHLAELAKHLADAASHRVDATQHMTSASEAIAVHKRTVVELENGIDALAETNERLAHELTL